MTTKKQLHEEAQQLVDLCNATLREKLSPWQCEWIDNWIRAGRPKSIEKQYTLWGRP